MESHKKIEIVEKILPLDSINSLDFSNNLMSVRNEKIVITTTSIEELGVCVVNLISPREHVFWNLGVYSTFYRALIGNYHKLRDGNVFLGSYLSNAEKIGCNFEAVFHHNFSFFNFCGADISKCTYLMPLNGRFLSMMVPLSKRQAVVDYFVSQAAYFGCRSVKRVREDLVLYVGGDLRRNPIFQALSAVFSYMDNDAVERSLEILNSAFLEDSERKKNADIYFRVFYGGAINFLLPKEVSKTKGSIVKLAQKRLDLFFELSRLPVIEGKIEDEIVGWQKIEDCDLYSMAIERLNYFLQGSTFVWADPLVES